MRLHLTIALTPLLALMLSGCGRSNRDIPLLNFCDLSRDFVQYRYRVIAVRGVYYNGLRQTCQQECNNGPWPSFVDLIGTSVPQIEREPDFDTDEESWSAVLKAEEQAKQQADKGKRVEVWVTVSGQLRTRLEKPRGGPCSLILSEYDAFRGYPAQLIVKRFTDIQVKENPNSPYNYGHMLADAP